MSSGRRQVTFCQIFTKFPLENFGDWTEADFATIRKSIQIFKQPEVQDSFNFNFLEARDIRLITQFFAVYGDDIRETDFKDCDKFGVSTHHCTCFLQDITSREAGIIRNVFRVLDFDKHKNCVCGLNLKLQQLRDILDSKS